MADTSSATGLVVQQWDSQFFKESLNANIFKPYMGTKTNSIIQVKEDLTKKPGDSITFALVNKLTGSGVTGSTTLEGAEESVVSRSQKVSITQYRHAVRIPVLEDQFSAIPLRNAGKDVLLDWNMELNRDHIIEQLGAINGVVYADASEAQKDAWNVDNEDRVQFGKLVSNFNVDHSTALATIDNTDDKLTPAALSLMKRLAKTSSPKIRPLKPRKGGVTSDSYILYAPSLLVRDLALNSVFTQANREARARGKFSNPLFRGADYIWDNIAIYEVEDIPIETSSTVDVGPCYLCGAQALGIAWAKRPQSIEEQFDYKDKQGYAIRQWYNVAKLQFGTDAASDTGDLKDHGLVTGWFASVADA
jgi:N4-gp56 family major capsid protein